MRAWTRDTLPRSKVRGKGRATAAASRGASASLWYLFLGLGLDMDSQSLSFGKVGFPNGGLNAGHKSEESKVTLGNLRRGKGTGPVFRGVTVLLL